MPLRTDGAALRERRLHKGLTIVELAARMEYSQHHVSQVELGRLNAGPVFLRKAAEHLDCAITDITNGVIERKRPEPTEQDSEAAA